MIKTFRKQYKEWAEVVEINTVTGEFHQFFYDVVDGQLMIFSDHKDNLFNMGWKSVSDYITQRVKTLYPEELKGGFDLYHLPKYEPHKKAI